MALTNVELRHLMEVLLRIMQASILVPLVVVICRWRHFTEVVRLLSWYNYLSIAGVVLIYLLEKFTPSNYLGLLLFNVGKIILFAAVYHQIVRSPRWRRLIIGCTVVSLVGIIGSTQGNMVLAVTIGRVTQCALLAGFAILYLEQVMTEKSPLPASRDPFWLLSVGQLIYSAGTVTAFSLDYLSITVYDQSLKYIFVSIVGLAFNAFLTLAFLRARRVAPRPATPDSYPSTHFATS